jgi:hypothetical protein
MRKVLFLQGIIGSILTATDFWITRKYLSVFGIQAEANPIMRFIATHFGVDGIAYFKILVFSILFGALCFVPDDRLERNVKLLSTINILLALIVAWGVFCLAAAV